MWYIYTMEYYSAIKKNEIMGRPRDGHTEWTKSDTERQISCDITHMCNLKEKRVQMNLFTKQK